MKKYCILLCCLCMSWLCSVACAANPAISASVDRDHIASGETVQLLVQREGTGNGQLDISPLKADFDILSSNSGTRVQITNGDMISQTQVVLVLAPKHDGKIQIPSLTWNGEQTETLELTVGGKGSSAGQQAGPTDAQHVTLTATADQDQPYVQAAVVLTVRLSTDQPITQASLELAPNDAVLISQLGTDRQMSEVRDGHSYQVVERKYLLFPQHSGKISIEGPVLAAMVTDMSNATGFDSDPFFASILKNSPMAGMMRSSHPLHLRAKPIELNVLPRPASQTGANWLPALSVKLSETWHADDSGIHVGEPLTRHMVLEAVGLTGAQLPDLRTLMTAPDGIKVYPDQGKIGDHPKGDSVIGSREQDIALIASQPGHYTMPPVQLVWWDTINNVQREATLPAHDFDVLPAIGGAATAAQPPTPMNNAAPAAPVVAKSSPNILAAPIVWWAVLTCIAVFLVAVVALVVWWFVRKRTTTDVPIIAKEPTLRVGSASGKLKDFHRDCMVNNPKAARRHLLDWAQLRWPLDPPVGLNALALRLNNPDIADLLRELDRCCYTDSPWRGENLARTFTHQPTADSTNSAGKELMELYP